MLKNNGVMFLRDYARPPPQHYILMEMHDEESEGEDVSQLSEADLLVWYSEHARPKQDPGCGGFSLRSFRRASPDAPVPPALQMGVRVHHAERQS